MQCGLFGSGGEGPGSVDGPSWLHVRLGDLGFLVEAEHHGPFRWVQIEPDHIDKFGFEVGVGRNLEGVDPSRFEVVVLPDPAHGVLADLVPFRHQPGHPLRRAVIGLDMQRNVSSTSASTVPAPSHDRRPCPGPIPRHRQSTLLDETSPPRSHRLSRRPTTPGDLVGRHTIGCRQQRPGLNHIPMLQPIQRRGSGSRTASNCRAYCYPSKPRSLARSLASAPTSVSASICLILSRISSWRPRVITSAPPPSR